MTALNRLLYNLEAKIQGNLVVAFHRTRSKKKIDAIKTGLMPGPRGMYGKGVYFTYTFESQQDEYMLGQYGEYIIKARINVSKFLFFNDAEGRKIYGPKYSIINELKKLLGDDFPIKVTFGVDPDTYKPTDEKEITSILARKIMIYVPLREKIIKKFDGIQFIGATDGNVLVSFTTKPSIVRPYAWAKVNDLEKKLADVKWHSYDYEKKNDFPITPHDKAEKKQLQYALKETFKELIKQGFKFTGQKRSPELVPDWQHAYLYSRKREDGSTDTALIKVNYNLDHRYMGLQIIFTNKFNERKRNIVVPVYQGIASMYKRWKEYLQERLTDLNDAQAKIMQRNVDNVIFALSHVMPQYLKTSEKLVMKDRTDPMRAEGSIDGYNVLIVKDSDSTRIQFSKRDKKIPPWHIMDAGTLDEFKLQKFMEMHIGKFLGL